MSTIQILGFPLLTLALAVPGAALAYNEKDAIRDCESHIRSEYKVSDLRDAQAEQIMDSEHHYKVHGLAKVDGDKHPWSCEIRNRHVTMAEYRGPKPEGMSTAEKLAIGAAAVAAGIAISEASKHGGEGHSSAAGAAGLQDLVGARGAGGESELQRRGYTFVKGETGGDSSYTNWRKGSHCVTVRTTDGRYDSIVDVPMADCEGGGHQGGSHAGGGGSGAADLQDLVGARGAGGEAELQRRGYNYVAGNKWSNGWHCVTVHTADGHFKSIVDTPMANCH